MIHEVTKTALNTNKNYDELIDNIHQDLLFLMLNYF